MVMVMRLLDGITKLEQKPCVCVKAAWLVLPPALAGLMEIAPMAQSAEAAEVQVLVTVAAPGCVLAPAPMRLLKYVFQSAVWFAPGLPAAPKF